MTIARGAHPAKRPNYSRVGGCEGVGVGEQTLPLYKPLTQTHERAS